MTEESPFGNREATDKLLYLDYTKATPEHVQELMRQGGNPAVYIAFMGEDNEIHNEGPVDKAILARNLPVASFLMSQGYEHHFQQHRIRIGERAFLIENGLEKFENPLMEYSRIAHHDIDFADAYISLLHKYKADLNTQDENGKTPLMVLFSAIECRKKSLIRVMQTVLKEFKYDYTIMDDYGRNLLYYVKDSHIGDTWLFSNPGSEVLQDVKLRTEYAYLEKQRVTRQLRTPPQESRNHPRV